MDKLCIQSHFCALGSRDTKTRCRMVTTWAQTRPTSITTRACGTEGQTMATPATSASITDGPTSTAARQTAAILRVLIIFTATYSCRQIRQFISLPALRLRRVLPSASRRSTRAATGRGQGNRRRPMTLLRRTPRRHAGIEANLPLQIPAHR